MLNSTYVPKTIVDKLAMDGSFNEEQLNKALNILKQSNGKQSLEQVLIDELGNDRHKVFQAFCRIYAFREIKLNPESISDNWVKYIQTFYDTLTKGNQDNFLKKKIIPFGLSEKNKDIRIFITPDPTDREIDQIIRGAGIKKFEIAYSKLEDVEEVLERVVKAENEFLQFVKEASEEVSFIDEEEKERGIDEEELTAAINQSILVNLFEGCLIEAVRTNASDIHIIPKEGNITEFYFRVDGRLSLWHRQEGTKPEALLAVAKDRSKNVDRFEWESAQDGFIQRDVDNALIRFRVSILPIVSSAYTRKYESVVIRVLDDRKVITDLEKLGFDGYAKEQFIKAINKPQGMVILTGPTGSGKSTTLIAALHQVMSPELNVLTVEDPVEYNIRGARQLKISHRMDFDQAIRSILRHDPDIVMVGEIRDSKTAEIAIKLANTGHLTFSTLHTNDAVGVISRLYKMGIEPFLISYAINLVVAQRLMRRLCSKCKKPHEDLDPAIPLSLGFTQEEVKNAIFYQAIGCDHCSKGYRGRMAIHEVLPFSADIRRLILLARDELDEDGIRQTAMKEGMVTLRASARKRALDGQTTLEEVVSVTTD